MDPRLFFSSLEQEKMEQGRILAGEIDQNLLLHDFYQFSSDHSFQCFKICIFHDLLKKKIEHLKHLSLYNFCWNLS